MGKLSRGDIVKGRNYPGGKLSRGETVQRRIYPEGNKSVVELSKGKAREGKMFYTLGHTILRLVKKRINK